MDRFPILTHARPGDTVAYRAGAPVARATFLAHARAVAAAFPPGAHLLNACTDRYHFAVTLVAGMLSGRTNLMPSTYTPEVVRQLAQFAPDCFVVGDGPEADDGALPRFAFPALAADARDEAPVPVLPADQRVAWVFTSGSTGAPVPHPKRWGKLVANIGAAARQLGLAGAHEAPFSLLGTVPPQHMYGFESTILLALLGGGAFVADRAFFPAEIVAQLARLPRPRVLVTTPYHLRTVLRSDEATPPADLLLSATAPLEAALARQAEAAFQAPLREIYGSTETGQIATRRPAEDAAWTLFPDIALETRDAATWASGGHIEAPVPLGDRIEPVDANRFRLLGRNADLINIAGKRSSIAYLERQLQAIDGVVDAAFHLPEQGDSEIVRLAAFVVAPGRSRAELLAALRERIDPLFLPRPLILLERLPRNATGKLPRETREALLAGRPATESEDATP
jgi:acyl-coenzyme A synthetase/AMP-(fatty) acid ligase